MKGRYTPVGRETRQLRVIGLLDSGPSDVSVLPLRGPENKSHKKWSIFKMQKRFQQQGTAKRFDLSATLS